MSLQIRRGTAAELANITPASGELIFTTDTQSVYVGNGVQPGGIPVAIGGGGNLTGVNVLASGVVSATGNVLGGNLHTVGSISATGNIYSGAYFFGDGSQLTGVTASGVSAAALTGTTLSSNVTTSTLTSVGTLGNLSVTGIVSAAGNVRGNYIIGNGSLLTSLPGANVSGNVANATYATSAGSATNAGTVTVNAQGNITSVGTLSSLTVTANVTGGNLLTAGLISSTGTITASSHLGTVVSVTGNVTANYLNGNGSALTGIVATSVGTLTSLSVTGSTQSGNILTAGIVSATGNVTGGNLRTAGLISATGNVTGNFFNGNGSALTGIVATTVGTLISLSVTGSTQSGNILTAGIVSATGNLIGGNVTTAGLISATGNITGGNLSGTLVTGTLTTAAQPNITSVGTLSSLAVTANITGGNLSVGTGIITVNNIVNGSTSATGNIGTVALPFNTVFAQATSAVYADLAELYLADAEYVPGTVVSFGGSTEITQSTTDLDVTVAGVVSTNPAYKMNSSLHGDHVVAVALVGRVPCRVTGPVKQGAMMVSAGDGTARAESNPLMGSVIGKALESFGSGVGIIEVVIGKL
jgi:hypothetical protein